MILGSTKTEIYDKTEQLCQRFSSLYSNLIMCSALVVIILPLFKIIWNYSTSGQPIEDIYELPSPCQLPFAVDSWPKFLVAFIINSTSMLLCICLTKVYLQGGYVGICIYLIILYRDMGNMIEELNEIR